MSPRGPRGEAGLVLPVALVVSTLLGVLALALVTLAGLEPGVARNLADATRARVLAEAGLEHARGALVESPDWSALLPTGGADDAIVIDTTALSGLGPAQGTYVVRVRNDWRAGDTALTGRPPDAGGRAVDANQHVVLASTGHAGRARRTVLAVARRVPLPLPPAAVAFTGEPALVLAGEGVEIDGRDHAMDGRPGSCAPAWAMSVAEASAEPTVEAAVPAALAPRLRGRAQDEAAAPDGANTIAHDAGLDSEAVARFTAAVRQHADVVVDGAAGGTAEGAFAGACGDDGAAGCWGTPDRPRIVRVVGPAAGETGPGLEIAGRVDGHGVLVIEDAAVRITGEFRWHGLVIVTGRGAGLEFAGGGAQAVLGGLVVDQRASPEAGPGLVAGDARLRRSCAAIDQAARARRLVRLWGWHEVPLY